MHKNASVKNAFFVVVIGIGIDFLFCYKAKTEDNIKS